MSGSIAVTITAGKPTNVVIPNSGELGYGTGVLKIVKTDAQTGAALKDAVFKVYSDSALTVLAGTITTNSAGTGTLEGLDPNTYYVAETTAPSGYKKLDGNLTAVIIANETTTLNVKNTKTEEQDYQTGTDDYNRLVIGGILLLLGAGFVILYLKRKVKA